jgi:cobalt/nickel transport system permease protein
MHIPDGVLEPGVWVPLAAASGLAVAAAARAARRRLADESIPLVGVMGAFVFALQMLNFPLAAGISDHVVGAGILAIILGPSIAVLAMTAIVTIQCLVFADGGIAALGANVFDMAILSTFAAYGTYRLLRRVLPTAAVAIGSMAGVLAGAGGAALWVILSKPYGAKFLAVMFGTHFLSGVVEAIVTVAIVRALQSAGLTRTPAPEAQNA